jgi:hypothetical protein
MKALEEIDVKGLKQACKELNGAGICKENIRFTGITNAKVLENFTKAIENLDEDKHDDIPDFVIDFYNELISDEVVDPADIDTSEDGEDQPDPVDPEPAEDPVVEEQGDAELPKEVEKEFKKEAKAKEKEKKKRKSTREPKDYDAPTPVSRSLKKSLVADRKKFKNFDEYSTHLRKNGPNTPTSYLDLIALDGITLKEGVKLFQEYIKENDISHNGYKTPGVIYEHIRARAIRSGFVYKKEGETYTLMGMLED